MQLRKSSRRPNIKVVPPPIYILVVVVLPDDRENVKLLVAKCSFFFCVYILCIALFYILSTLLIDATTSEFSDIYIYIYIYMCVCIYIYICVCSIYLIERTVQRRSVFLYEVVLLDLSGNSILVSKFKNWANLIF